MDHQKLTYGFRGESTSLPREDRFSPQNEADYERLARIAAAEEAGTDLLLDVRSIELYDGLGEDEGIIAHQEALATLAEDGRAALNAVSRHVVTPQLERVVQAVTYYTPAQERVASVYVAHALGEALAARHEVRGRMQGEVVASCVPAELVAAGEREAVPHWVELLHSAGLPASLAELGFLNLNESRTRDLCGDALAGMMG